MSAIGSVIFFEPSQRRAFGLPTALRHPGDVSLEGQLAKAEAAEGELPEIGAWTSAPLTAVTEPDLELRRFGFLGDFRSRGHDY
jgi:hypothetical protein